MTQILPLKGEGAGDLTGGVGRVRGRAMSKPKKRPALPRRLPLDPGRIVYVVELDRLDEFPKRRLGALLEANPNAKEGAPIVYVGETGLSALKRLYNHVTGHQSSWWVRVLGKRLVRLDEGMPSFSQELPEEIVRHLAKLGKRSKEDSKAREIGVAQALREAGWWVVVG